jgi:hypothetical protein
MIGMVGIRNEYEILIRKSEREPLESSRAITGSYQ